MAIVIGMMRRLFELMQAEEALLKEMRLARLGSSSSRRWRSPGATSLSCAGCASAPEALAALGAEERGQLEAAMREFQAAARANAERVLN